MQTQLEPGRIPADITIRTRSRWALYQEEIMAAVCFGGLLSLAVTGHVDSFYELAEQAVDWYLPEEHHLGRHGDHARRRRHHPGGGRHRRE